MYDKICYKKNYVSQVIFRIDLANPIKELETQLPKEIGLKVKENYPIFEPQQIIGGELRIDNLGINNLGTNNINEWVFYSRDRNDICKVLNNSIMFVYNKYNTFEDIKSVILDIINTINKKYEKYELAANRIGMRFINVIPLNGNTDLISEDVIKPLNKYSNSNKLMRAITSVEYYLDEEDINIRNQSGYINKDYPAEMVDDSFTIDIDAYTKGINYLDEVEKLVILMHGEIQRVFENSITDELKNIMNKSE